MRGESTDDVSQVRFLRVRNESGEEIPGGAAMKNLGVIKDGERLFFRVTKPDEDNMKPGTIIFNTRVPIAAAADGIGTRDLPFWALVDAAPPLAGPLGTENGEWHLLSGGKGFLSMGTDADDAAYAMVVGNEAALAEPPEPGCGLYIDEADGKLKVNVGALAGDGLMADPANNGDTVCKLRIDCIVQDVVTDVTCEAGPPAYMVTTVTPLPFPNVVECPGDSEDESTAAVVAMGY